MSVNREIKKFQRLGKLTHFFHAIPALSRTSSVYQNNRAKAVKLKPERLCESLSRQVYVALQMLIKIKREKVREREGVCMCQENRMRGSRVCACIRLVIVNN